MHERLTVQAGAGVGQVGGGGPPIRRITARRAQVLGCIASHHTNAQIAALLAISVATVERHVDDLRCITGCRTKGDLARWWQVYRDTWRPDSVD